MSTRLVTLGIALIFFHISSQAAVILQYHHVSNDTPSQTSISPDQFNVHLQYLADNKFTVVPLFDLINAIKKQQPIADKTVAITFDDAYLDILLNGKPLLDKYNYPFTIFINPGLITESSSQFLSWQQLKTMANDGVIIANHGFEHNSLARPAEDIPYHQWLEKQINLINHAENIIKEKTGKSWRFFAYPYGEYTPEAQQLLKENNYTAFSQQSGAVGLATDLSSVPRFPASIPYDNMTELTDKLHSLPFAISLQGKNAQTIQVDKQSHSVTLNIVVADFEKSMLTCYISGLGRQRISWHNDESFTIHFTAPLPVGRVRANCTAPSLQFPDRYYWYSKPWLVVKENGQWFGL